MKKIRNILIGLIFGGGFGANIGAYLANIYDWNPVLDAIQMGFIIGASVATIPTALVALSIAISKWMRSGNKSYYQPMQNQHLNTNFN